MSVQLSNVFPYACHVYVSPRVDANTPVAHVEGTDWVDVGAYKAGTAKMTPNNLSYDYQLGKAKLGQELKFECDALETDAAKLAALEALQNKVCDIILKPITQAVTKAIKLFAMTPMVFGPEGAVDGKNPVVVKMEANSTHPLASDAFAVIEVDWFK